MYHSPGNLFALQFSLVSLGGLWELSRFTSTHSVPPSRISLSLRGRTRTATFGFKLCIIGVASSSFVHMLHSKDCKLGEICMCVCIIVYTHSVMYTAVYGSVRQCAVS